MFYICGLLELPAAKRFGVQVCDATGAGLYSAGGNKKYMGKIAINIATGSLQQPEMIVGIDLGTTNSLVAIIHPESGKPIAL